MPIRAIMFANVPCVSKPPTLRSAPWQAAMLAGTYALGQSVSADEMKTLNLPVHAACPRWNYMLKPRPAQQGAQTTNYKHRTCFWTMTKTASNQQRM